MSDPVNHPSHYTQGKIECIDFITDKKLNFCRGNAIKYIVRAGIKDKSKEIEDLKKAIFYIEREIKDIQNAQTKSTSDTPSKPSESYIGTLYHVSCMACGYDWWNIYPFQKPCPNCGSMTLIFSEDKKDK